MCQTQNKRAPSRSANAWVEQFAVLDRAPKKMESKTLRIITLYRATATNSGGNSTLHQQKEILLNDSRNISPDQAFVKDLDGAIQKYKRGNEALIVTGDFNATLRDPLIKGLMTKHCLTDVMSNTHHETPPTRDPGSKTIDHILCTENIFIALQHAEYLPFCFGIISYHRGILLDLKWDMLTTKGRQPPERIGRTFRSTNVDISIKYKQEITAFLLTTKLIAPVMAIPENPRSRERRRAIQAM